MRFKAVIFAVKYKRADAQTLKKKKPAMITTNTALILFLKPNKEVIDKKMKDF